MCLCVIERGAPRLVITRPNRHGRSVVHAACVGAVTAMHLQRLFGPTVGELPATGFDASEAACIRATIAKRAVGVA